MEIIMRLGWVSCHVNYGGISSERLQTELFNIISVIEFPRASRTQPSEVYNIIIIITKYTDSTSLIEFVLENYSLARRTPQNCGIVWSLRGYLMSSRLRTVSAAIERAAWSLMIHQSIPSTIDVIRYKFISSFLKKNSRHRFGTWCYII